MPRKPTDEKIAALRQKQLELDRQIRAHEKDLKEQERKRHTTKLIAYGLLVQYELQSGTLIERDVQTKLDKLLTQNTHRAAVGLPLLGIGGKSSKNDNDQSPPADNSASINGTKQHTGDSPAPNHKKGKTQPARSHQKRELTERKQDELEQHF